MTTNFTRRVHTEYAVALQKAMAQHVASFPHASLQVRESMVVRAAVEDVADKLETTPDAIARILTADGEL